MSEIHQTYQPSANASNVRNVNNSQLVGPGQNAATGNVPLATINEPDNQTGSSSVVIPNQSQGIVITPTSVKGRFDQFTVITNPA